MFSLITRRLYHRFYFGLHSAFADVSIFVRFDCDVSAASNFFVHIQERAIDPGWEPVTASMTLSQSSTKHVLSSVIAFICRFDSLNRS